MRHDLNRRARPHEPLPGLVPNAYFPPGYDCRETARSWRESGHQTPPVMITVVNRTETAARVNHALGHGRVLIEELCDPDRILHIDSRALKQAEETEEPVAALCEDGDKDADVDAAAPRPLTAGQRAERLRRMVDTVGKSGQPGENVQYVWKATTAQGDLFLYVGRTGDDVYTSANPPVVRVGQHLGRGRAAALKTICAKGESTPASAPNYA